MTWTEEDGADVETAIRKMRDAIECLSVDVRHRKVRGSTRDALDAAMQALLALDDVYFEDDAGAPVPQAWARARTLLGNARPGAEHPPSCPWWKDWHACDCGALDRQK